MYLQGSFDGPGIRAIDTAWGINSFLYFAYYFDFVLTCEDYKKSKPDPEPFLTAIKRTGLKREHCIIVEDSERGLDAAKAAGIRCIVVPHNLTRDNNFSGAYRVLDSIREVVPAVLQLLS